MSAPSTPERLDEIEASIPAIVRGPWRLERDNALGEWVIWTDADDPILQVLIWGSDLGPFIESVPTVIPELLAEIRRLRGEVETLADLDDAASRRSELQAERDRAVTRWHEEHKRAEDADAERDRLAGQVAALHTERQLLARGGADRADELDAAEAERARLATELGALDALRAADQVAMEDLQAAYDRLGDQAQRVVDAASQFRAERDRLHDALGDVLVGPWESNGAGDVRSPWIPAAEAEGWRRLLASTPRSEREGETAQEGPEAPADSSGSSGDAPGPGAAQRGAAGRDGAVR